MFNSDDVNEHGEQDVGIGLQVGIKQLPWLSNERELLLFRWEDILGDIRRWKIQTGETLNGKDSSDVKLDAGCKSYLHC